MGVQVGVAAPSNMCVSCKRNAMFLLLEAVSEQRQRQQKQKSHKKKQKMAKKWPQEAQEAVLECATPIDRRLTGG